MLKFTEFLLFTFALAFGATRAADNVAKTLPLIVRGTTASVALDGSGNQYVAGYFFGSQDFNPRAGEDTHDAAGRDAFVTRFNADGSYAWTQTFGGTLDDYALGVAVNGSTVYVVGSFNSTDAGFGSPGGFSSLGNYDAFVLALNTADGAPVPGFGAAGVQKIGGNGVDTAYGVTVANSTVYVAGGFTSTDLGIGVAGGVISTGNTDAFVAALDGTTGEAIPGFASKGVQTLGGSNVQVAYNVAVLGTAVFAAGDFRGSDAGVGGLGSIASAGARDVFVLALNSSTGAAINTFGSGGVQTFGGTGEDYGNAFAVAGGSVYAGGYFYSTDAGIGGTGSVAARANDDGFVLALDAATGAGVNGFGTGGVQTLTGAFSEDVYGLAVLGSTLYVAGDNDSPNFGIGAPAARYNAGYVDTFVAALNTATGAPVTSFGAEGIQIFGGRDADYFHGIAAGGSRVFVTGNLTSQDAGTGHKGNYSNDGFGDFLLELDATTGQSFLPQFSGRLHAGGESGGSFSFTPAALNATSVNAANLPVGLSFSGGVISGTLPTVATLTLFNISLSAANSYGQTAATLELTVIPDAVTNSFPPVIQGSVNGTAVDAAGNRYVAGNFRDTRDFNPGIGADIRISSNGFIDAFVTRFNADGSYAWTQTFGGTGSDTANAIAISGTTVYASGYFEYADAGVGGEGDFFARGLLDAFVLALDAQTGAPKSSFGTNGVQIVGGTDEDIVYAMTAAGSTLFLTGATYSPDFGVGAPGSIDPEDGDVFLAAIDGTTGAAVNGFGVAGVQTFGGTDYEAGYAIAVSNTSVFIAGEFNSDNAGIGGSGTLAASGAYDAFIAAVDRTTGAPLNTFGTGGAVKFGGSVSDRAQGLALSGSTLYATGLFRSANAGLGGTGSFATAGGPDAFVLALDASSGAGISGFGNGGVQTLSGSGDEIARGLEVNGGTLFVSGYFNSANTGLGGVGTFASSGNNDVFVLALDPATGAGKSGFGTGGLQKFGGTLDDGYGGFGPALAVGGSSVFTAGFFASTNAGVGGPGTLSATGFAAFLLELDSQTGAMANRAPVILSAPTATPNPAKVDEDISFSAPATDADGDTLAYLWEFGDGRTSQLSSTAHAYDTEGNFTVKVTVSDGKVSTSATVVVLVRNPFIEVPEFAVTKAQLKFTFTAQSKDALALLGSVPVTLSSRVDKALSVQFGGLDLSFTLNIKGQSADKAFKLLGKSKNGTFLTPLAKFQLTLKNKPLFGSLSSLGFTNATVTKAEISTFVFMTVEGKTYRASKIFIYSAKQGKSGLGKGK